MMFHPVATATTTSRGTELRQEVAAIYDRARRVPKGHTSTGSYQSKCQIYMKTGVEVQISGKLILKRLIFWAAGVAGAEA